MDETCVVLIDFPRASPEMDELDGDANSGEIGAEEMDTVDWTGLEPDGCHAVAW